MTNEVLKKSLRDSSSLTAGFFKKNDFKLDQGERKNLLNFLVRIKSLRTTIAKTYLGPSQIYIVTEKLLMAKSLLIIFT